jgi:hypothetical protein
MHLPQYTTILFFAFGFQPANAAGRRASSPKTEVVDREGIVIVREGMALKDGSQLFSC